MPESKITTTSSVDLASESPYYIFSLEVGTQLSGEDDRALLLWPIFVAHR